MKTAISLPDRLFKQAEHFAERQGKSRSELYRQALSEYLERHDPDSITRSWNEVADAIGDERDRFVDVAAAEVLRRTEW